MISGGFAPDELGRLRRTSYFAGIPLFPAGLRFSDVYFRYAFGKLMPHEDTSVTGKARGIVADIVFYAAPVFGRSGQIVFVQFSSQRLHRRFTGIYEFYAG